MKLRSFVLLALAEGEAYGAEVRERVRLMKGTGVLLGELMLGNVYGILRDLESEGLATRRDEDGGPERGFHPRTYYKLTAAGETAVAAST